MKPFQLLSIILYISLILNLFISCSSHISYSNMIYNGNKNIGSARDKEKRVLNIKNFNFSITSREHKEAEKILIDFQKGDMNPPYIGENDLKRWRLTYALTKAIDIKNGYPILKWLINTYSRDRLNGHKLLYKTSTYDEYNFKEDKYTIYPLVCWWIKDSKYVKFFNSIDHTKKGLVIMEALSKFSDYHLPRMALNPQIYPVIYDNLNQCSDYILSSWSLASKLTKSIKSDFNNITSENIKHIWFDLAPIQVDILIIPQSIGYKLNFVSEMNDIGIDLDANYLFKNIRYEEMAKKNKLWDLEQYLIQSGYTTKEYLCSYLGSSCVEEKICNMFLDLVYDLNINNLIIFGFLREINNPKIIPNDIVHTICLYLISPCWENKDYLNRYIFIIDRRHPDNLKAKNMEKIEPNYNKSPKDWQDKIYLFKPKINGKIKYNELMSEVFFNNSTYLFPNIENEEDPIKITDDLNGYKIGISFHLDHDSNDAYLYLPSGAQKFELEDTRWFLKRYFCKINNKEQELNEENIAKLKEYAKNKKLPNYGFDEFYKQCLLI